MIEVVIVCHVLRMKLRSLPKAAVEKQRSGVGSEALSFWARKACSSEIIHELKVLPFNAGDFTCTATASCRGCRSGHGTIFAAVSPVSALTGIIHNKAPV